MGSFALLCLVSRINVWLCIGFNTMSVLREAERRARIYFGSEIMSYGLVLRVWVVVWVGGRGLYYEMYVEDPSSVDEQLESNILTNGIKRTLR